MVYTVCAHISAPTLSVLMAVYDDWCLDYLVVLTFIITQTETLLRSYKNGQEPAFNYVFLLILVSRHVCCS